jgi:hypothetical protein
MKGPRPSITVDLCACWRLVNAVLQVASRVHCCQNLYLELGSLVKSNQLAAGNFLSCSGKQTYDVSIFW